jgi:hypothetical protein
MQVDGCEARQTERHSARNQRIFDRQFIEICDDPQKRRFGCQTRNFLDEMQFAVTMNPILL